MATCHICLDDLKNPVALPCGHIFCGGCIFKAIQSVQPYSHLHACPLCRTLYNITPVNMQVVPPNLRPFVTPSIRKVYLNTPELSATPEQQGDAPCTSSACAAAVSSISSETQATISRLEAENLALRTSCAMWRRRAELHGSANLGLLNFAKMVRDQATLLAREREQLKDYCQSLKHKLDVYESNQQSVDQLLQALHEASMRPALEPESSYSPQERCIKLLPTRARSGAQQPIQRTPSSAPPQPAPSASYGYDEHCRKRAKLARDQPTSGSSMDGLLGTAGRAIFLPQTGQEPSLHTEAA